MLPEYRKIESHEMQGVIRFVKKMTESMTFDENMESANWPKSRKRNNFFYKLMPKEKGVKFKRLNIGNRGVMLAECEKTDDSQIIIYMHGGCRGCVSCFCGIWHKYTRNNTIAARMCRIYEDMIC